MKQQSFEKFSIKKQTSLLTEMVRTDFKLRYQNSALGYLWSLLKPLFLFAILFVVFTKFLRLGAGVPNYAYSLLLGIILWTFFIDASTGGLKSVVGNGSLIRKIYIPRYLIPIASVASAFINMLISLVVVFAFVLLFAPFNALSWSTLVIFPLLLAQLAIFSMGAALLLSAAFVKFRDLEYIWDVVRQGLFYAIPIIYPLSRIPYEEVRKVLMLNPLSQIIQESRSVITYDGVLTTAKVFDNKFSALIPILVTMLVFVIGLIYFHKKSHTFAENV